jgi:hypothetical protein
MIADVGSGAPGSGCLPIEVLEREVGAKRVTLRQGDLWGG